MTERFPRSRCRITVRFTQSHLIRLLLILLLPVLLAQPGFGFRKTGTTAAAFLQIPAGARFPAMGNAGVALESTADALFFNPASAWSRSIGIHVAHTDWIAGLRHQSLAVTFPVGTDYMCGLHIVSFGGDPIPQTTLQQQEGTGVMAEYGDLAAGLSGVARLTDRFTVGVNGKFIHQKLFHETASTFAIDVGTHLKTDLPGFTIGMAMTNLGGEMQLEGRDLYLEDETGAQYETSKWQLPLTFQTGIGWRLLASDYAVYYNDYNTVTLAADARHINEGVTNIHTGIEYSYADAVFGRFGHIFGHDTQSWTFGAGVRVYLYSYTVQADIALSELEDLGGVQRVALSLQKRIRR